MRKLKLFFTVLFLAVLAMGNAWAADEVYKTSLFGASYNSAKVSSYTATFSATNNGFKVDLANFNNNNNGWNLVKCGRKGTASVATITTNAAIDKKVTKVVITFDAITADKVNSIKLYSGTSASSCTQEEGSFAKSAGTQSVAIAAANQAAGRFYQIKFDCASGTANGLVSVKTIEFYAPEDVTADQVVSPSLPEAGDFFGSKEIAISCETAGAAIYYTTDGSTPDATSTLYSAPFSITESCTVKAIAIKAGMTNSSVASAAYTKNPTYASLAELVAAGAPVKPGYTVRVTLTDEVIKSFPNTKSVNVQSGSQSVQIYCASTVYPSTWQQGGTLSGTLTCKWELYNNSVWELMPTDWSDLTYTAPTTPVVIPEYASLAALVAGEGTPTTDGKKVKVTLDKEAILNFATRGLFIKYDEERDIELYHASANPPSEWAVKDSLSAVLLEGDWKLFNSTWELIITDWSALEHTPYVAPELSLIAVKTAPTKVAYKEGEKFDPAGLVITLTYSNSDTEDVAYADHASEFSFAPALTAELATTDAEVVITYAGKTCNQAITVAAETRHIAQSNGAFTTVSGDLDASISFESFQGGAATAPANYNNGIRLYQKGGYIQIKAVAGCKLDEVVITTTATYASTTVGVAKDDAAAPTTRDTWQKSTAYSTANLNCDSVRFYCLGTTSSTRLEIAHIKVYYTGEATPELKGIVLSGNYQKQFALNETFNHDNMVVTASYIGSETTNNVTANAVFSTPDMSVNGVQEVTVSYTEDGITKEVSYNILVGELEDEAIKFSEVTTSTAISTVKAGSFTLIFDKAEGSNNPMYSNSNKDARVYVNNTLEIQAISNIFMVVFTCSEDVDAKTKTGTQVSAADAIWAVDGKEAVLILDGATNDVTLTMGGTMKFTDIEVFYADQREAVRLNLTAGKYSTFCPERLSAAPVGAKVYTIAYEEANALYVDEVTDGLLQAGVGYIVEAEDTEIKAIEVGAAKNSALAAANGLQGYLGAAPKVFEASEVGHLYGLAGGKLVKIGAGATLPSGRAYLNREAVPQGAPVGEAPVRGRRVISFEQTATELMTAEAAGQAEKVIIRGALFIRRAGKLYSAEGQLVK